jgi:hypothetical protein
VTRADHPLRSLTRAASLGAAAAFVLFALLLTYGRPLQLAPRETLGNFYDAQAESFLHGHLTVDPNEVSFEGFRIGGRTYEYQGPVPALARVPIAAITKRFHGRLTRISMLLADVVALWYLVLLLVEVRRVVRGDAPAGRAELAWTAIATFGLGTSSLLYLASKAWVYHEALIWGAALSLGSLFHLVAHLSTDTGANPGAADPGASAAEATGAGVRPSATPGGHHLGWAAVLGGLALLTRSSVGAGPIAAVALAAAVQGVRAFGARGGRGEPRWSTRLASFAGWRPAGRQGLAILVLGVVVPVGLYMAVNQAKFGSPVSLPADKQVLVKFDPAAQRALAANHGSLFSPKFTPSIVVQSLRPDAIRFSRQFPFIGFPAHRPTAFGHVLFEELDWSSSLPDTEPLVLLLGLVGLFAVIAPERLARSRGAAALRIPVLGAAVGGAAFVTIGYMANRYYSDLFPLLALLAVVGLQVVGGRLLDGSRRALRTAATTGLVLLALWGAWANLGLGLEYQRVIAPGAPTGTRASWIETQARLGPKPPFTFVGVDQSLPADPALGAIAVVGHCGGVYRSNGSIWQSVEGTSAIGSYRVTVTLDGAPLHPVALLTSASSTGTSRLLVDPAGGGFVRFVVRTDAHDTATLSLSGPRTRLVPGHAYELTITFDWREGYAEVDLGSTQLLATNATLVHAAPTIDPDFPGHVVIRPEPTPVCHALTGH